jgi:hypothetical protein
MTVGIVCDESTSRSSLLRGTMGQMADVGRLQYACAAGSLFHKKREAVTEQRSIECTTAIGMQRE